MSATAPPGPVAPPAALVGARIFDGARWREDHALVTADGRVAAITPLAEAPAARVDVGGLILAPGFVDWQVNGGGGALVNADPSPRTLAAVADAHARRGTTALLPTVITDAPEVRRAALDAAAACRAAGAPGVVGLHVEGPHIGLARKGAHDARFIAPLSTQDRALYAGCDVGRLVITLAPEAATPADVAALAAAGVIVSVGHSDASHADATALFDAGARAATHLFNAMSPLASRAPGVVGAALDHPGVTVGLIADGFHVAPAALRLATRLKAGGAATLVSDAMATAAGGPDAFTLQGRAVTRRDGRLTLADGTLAGSDLDLGQAVRHATRAVGLALEDALRMASTWPARLLGLSDRGTLAPGARADVVALTPELAVAQVWRGGVALL